MRNLGHIFGALAFLMALRIQNDYRFNGLWDTKKYRIATQNVPTLSASSNWDLKVGPPYSDGTTDQIPYGRWLERHHIE